MTWNNGKYHFISPDDEAEYSTEDEADDEHDEEKIETREKGIR